MDVRLFVKIECICKWSTSFSLKTAIMFLSYSIRSVRIFNISYKQEILSFQKNRLSNLSKIFQKPSFCLNRTTKIRCPRNSLFYASISSWIYSQTSKGHVQKSSPSTISLRSSNKIIPIFRRLLPFHLNSFSQSSPK